MLVVQVLTILALGSFAVMAFLEWISFVDDWRYRHLQPYAWQCFRACLLATYAAAVLVIIWAERGML